jgi:hypothetical protein
MEGKKNKDIWPGDKEPRIGDEHLKTLTDEDVKKTISMAQKYQWAKDNYLKQQNNGR